MAEKDKERDGARDKEQPGLRIPWTALSAFIAIFALALTTVGFVRSGAKAEGVADTKLQAAEGLRDRVVRIETQVDAMQGTLKEHGTDLKEILRRIPSK